MAIVYWLLIKIREKDCQLYDEKQRLDVGRSAFLSLGVTTVVLCMLFDVQYFDRDGVVGYLWCPVFLFIAMLIFSAGNLVYSRKA